MRLNDEQKMAIESTSMNTIVIAGAGTGKTSTIIGRVNYLLEHDVNPESILILSFTKKSAKEIHASDDQNNIPQNFRPLIPFLPFIFRHDFLLHCQKSSLLKPMQQVQNLPIRRF